MNYMYVAVLSTDSYLTGALVLNEALKHLNCIYPLTVLITKDVSPQAEIELVKRGIKTIRRQDNIIMSKDIQKRNENVGYKYWNYTFDSLYVFGMTQFDKIVYLDCDILPLINLDHLFEKTHMSAAHDPGTKDLSSGVMVIEPKINEDIELIKMIPLVAKNRVYFGDQNILQAYYTEWPNQTEKHLDDKYNAFVGYLNYFIYNGYTFKDGKNSIAVVHFLGEKKPWMRTLEETEKLKKEYIDRDNPYGAEALDMYSEYIDSLNLGK